MPPLLTALLLALFPAAQGSVPRSGERIDGWTHDLDAWLAALEREHYVFREHGLPDAMYTAADELREQVERYSDERILCELQRIAALAGDGHTYVLPFAPRVEAAALPLSFYFFADGVFVIDAPSEHERCVGAEVLALGSTPIATVLARLGEWVSRDNEQGIRWIGPTFLRLRGVLEAIAGDIDAARVPITLRLRDGTEETLVLAPRVEAPATGIPKLVPSRLPGAPPPPLYLADVARRHWLRVLPESTLYVQFNQVVDGPEGTLAEFAAELGRALDAARPEQLVIDVRHNNGGDATLLSPLIAELRRFERERPDGRLVVLMGRNTFSAAQIFLARADRETKALFAGEPSSSRPNFVGEENEFVLPWSGAYASISDRYHETIPGDTRAFIAPEIPLELTSADYFANRDPLLELVLAR